MSQRLSLMSLFELGAHRGNGRSKLNPRLKSRIFGYKDGLCLIDLVKTIQSIEEVNKFLSRLGEQKKQLLLVGTADHIKNNVPALAAKFETENPMSYINYRWLGGTLTNWATIRKTLKSFEKLENILENKEFFDKLSRNEQLNIQKQYTRTAKFFGGLRNLRNNKPGAVIVLDGPNNSIAVKEAELMNIPVIVLTNTSIKILPKNLNKTILTNIYSTNSVEFIFEILVEAYNQGLKEGAKKRLLEENSKVK